MDKCEDKPDPAAGKVLEESKRFEAALPTLLKGPHAGRWIIFKDGAVQGDFASQSEALRAAVAKYGREGGFVVVNVAPQDPTPISAAYEFV